MGRARVFIRPFNANQTTAGVPESEFVDVTNDVMSKIKVKDYLNTNAISIGATRIPEIKIKLFNRAGRYDHGGGLFTAAKGAQIKNSLVRFVWYHADKELVAGFYSPGLSAVPSSPKIIFEGVIDDQDTKRDTSKQTIEFRVLSKLSVLKQLPPVARTTNPGQSHSLFFSIKEVLSQMDSLFRTDAPRWSQIRLGFQTDSSSTPLPPAVTVGDSLLPMIMASGTRTQGTEGRTIEAFWNRATAFAKNYLLAAYPQSPDPNALPGAGISAKMATLLGLHDVTKDEVSRSGSEKFQQSSLFDQLLAWANVRGQQLAITPTARDDASGIVSFRSTSSSSEHFVDANAGISWLGIDGRQHSTFFPPSRYVPPGAVTIRAPEGNASGDALEIKSMTVSGTKQISSVINQGTTYQTLTTAASFDRISRETYEITTELEFRQAIPPVFTADRYRPVAAAFSILWEYFAPTKEIEVVVSLNDDTADIRPFDQVRITGRFRNYESGDVIFDSSNAADPANLLNYTRWQVLGREVDLVKETVKLYLREEFI